MITKHPAKNLKCLMPVLLTALAFGLPDAGIAQSDPMTHPINCATAKGDIRALSAEKQHAQDQQLKNIAAITPAGALLGMIKGTEKEHLEMLSGDYEKKIDARIAQTKAECKL